MLSLIIFIMAVSRRDEDPLQLRAEHDCVMAMFNRSKLLIDQSLRSHRAVDEHKANATMDGNYRGWRIDL